MKYFVFDLSVGLSYHYSGKSVNTDESYIHLRRVLKDYELFFVTDGKLFIEQEEEAAVDKNQVQFHIKNRYQGGTRPSASTFYWLHIDGKITVCENEEAAEKLCAENDGRIYFSERFTLTEPERVTFFLTQLNHYAFERENEFIKNHLTMALFAELARQYKKSSEPYVTDRRFSEILYYIALNLKKDVSVNELAEKFQYNPKYLCRLFKKFTGKTPKNYIVYKRLDYAAKLLVASNETVKSVSAEAGFSDEYYFMRVFKKRFGVTPKSYRNTFSGCSYS